MKSIVISLSHAHERRKCIEQRFAEFDLPFEFMDAIDARELSQGGIAETDTRFRRRWGLRPLAPAEIACWLSHVRAIRQVSAGPQKMAAIFEDDAVLQPALPAVLDALENCPVLFDLVSLARRKPERPLIFPHHLMLGRSMGRVRYTEYGAEGYVITREAARHLMTSMTRMRLPVDMELMSFWVHRLNLFFLDRPAVEHDDDAASQLTPERARILAGWKTRRLRETAYRLQIGVRKRLGFRHLVRGTIR